MLLEPDEDGWIDERSMFRFIRLMLPSVPDRGLEGVIDGFMGALAEEGDESTDGHRRVHVDKFLDRRDLVDKLIFHT